MHKLALVLALAATACIPEPIGPDDTDADTDTSVDTEADTDADTDTETPLPSIEDALTSAPEGVDIWGQGFLRGNEHPVHPVANDTAGTIETPLLWLDAADGAWARVSDDHELLFLAQSDIGWHWVDAGTRFNELAIQGEVLVASGGAHDASVRTTLTADRIGVVVVPTDRAPDADAVITLECGAACDGDPGPGTIALPDDQFHEAFVAAPAGGVFVGSMSDGAITRVDADGTVHPFAPAREGWLQMGMLVDTPRNLLWVCAVQFEGFLGEVRGYDLDTGAIVQEHDLTDINANATCNDLDLAANGHIYVSDRDNPYLYRVQPDQGIALQVAESELFNGLLGSNGVAVTPDQQAVIVGNYAPARLAVATFSDPSHPIEMTFTGATFSDGLTGGADGIFWHGDALYVSFPGKLFRVVPHGRDWTQASLWEVPLDAGVCDVQPIGDTLYVGNGQPINFAADLTPDPFTVTPVPWSAWEIDLAD